MVPALLTSASSRPNSDPTRVAMAVSAAASATSAWASRVRALVNVSETPVRAVAVERALDEGTSYAEVAGLASVGLHPTPSHRASAEYKLHLTRVLTRRVIEQAAAGLATAG